MTNQSEQGEANVGFKEGYIVLASVLRNLARIVVSKAKIVDEKKLHELLGSEEMQSNAGRVDIIAHKAGALEAPEGTRVAMEKALEYGATLDVDVRMTKDGELVICHPFEAEAIDPSSKVKGNISSLTLEEVKQLDAGYTFTTNKVEFPYRGKDLKVLTLKEAMEAFPEARFAIHLLGQNEGIEEKLISVIGQNDAFERVFVAGFSDRQLKRVKKLSENKIKRGGGALETIAFLAAVKSGGLPKVSFDYLIPGGEESPQAKSRFEVYGAKLMDLLRRKKLPDQEYVEACRKLNLPIYIWTVNEKAEALLLIATGVDGIYTDKPSMLYEIKKNLGGIDKKPVPENKEKVPEKQEESYLESMTRDFATTLVDGLSTFIITYAAAENLGWENRTLTPDDLIAEVKRMERVVQVGGAPAAEIDAHFQRIVQTAPQGNYPELNPQLEDILLVASERLLGWK